MSELPSALFIIDPMVEITAVMEARKLEIPIVAVCDTNCDPDLIDYPIPGNDDAIRSVKLFCNYVAEAVSEGKMIYEKAKLDSVKGAAAALDPMTEAVVMDDSQAGEIPATEPLPRETASPVQEEVAPKI